MVLSFDCSDECLHMAMLYVCGRRFRSRRATFMTILTFFFFTFFLIHFNPSTIIVTEYDENPRLFCVLVLTHPTHSRFVQLTSITWGKHCRQLAIVQQRPKPPIDDDPQELRSPIYVDLWTRIVASIRRSIVPFGLISDNDTLVIVPAPTYIFHEKLSTLFVNRTTTRALFIIHEQPEANAYVLSGSALREVRDTKLIENCLEKSYPGSRETQLWTCVKYFLRRQERVITCEKNDCFVRYHRNQLTLAHIKNGFCLKHSTDNCQSLALLYPTTPNEMLTLEFFKYRLKPKSPSHSIL